MHVWTVEETPAVADAALAAWMLERQSDVWAELVAGVRASPRHVASPDDACLLLPWFDTSCTGNICTHPASDTVKAEWLAAALGRLPGWAASRGGNTLLVDLSSNHAPRLPVGRGIYAASSFWGADESYRHGFDLPLPLWNMRWAEYAGEGNASAALARRNASRPLLLSFKGQRMFFCHHKLCAPPDLVSAIRDGGLRPTASYGHSWVRNRLGALHNGQDIVMATQCERELREPAACNATCKARCSTDRLLYESLDYEQLMANSSFALVLPGIAPMSYRLAEAMGFGAIPVIASDFITLPFTRVLDWRRFSVQAAESSLEALPDRLRAIPAEVVADMRREARAAYDRCFASPGQIALCTLDEIEATHLL